MIVCLFLLFSACQPAAEQSAAKEKQPAKQEKKEVTYKPKTEAISDGEMKKIMSVVTKVELLFYLGDNTISTDVLTPERIRYFAIYIDPKPAKVPTTCRANGSAIFFNEEGDIMIDAEFNNQPECNYIQMRREGKVYTHALTEAGRAYFQSFVDMATKNAKTMKH